jgi:hypothetical protein
VHAVEVAQVADCTVGQADQAAAYAAHPSSWRALLIQGRVSALRAAAVVRPARVVARPTEPTATSPGSRAATRTSTTRAARALGVATRSWRGRGRRRAVTSARTAPRPRRCKRSAPADFP